MIRLTVSTFTTTAVIHKISTVTMVYFTASAPFFIMILVTSMTLVLKLRAANNSNMAPRQYPSDCSN